MNYTDKSSVLDKNFDFKKCITRYGNDFFYNITEALFCIFF